jgi:prepilin peptidase CpaA
MDGTLLFLFPVLMIVPITSDLLSMKIPNWIPATLIAGNLAISLWLRLSWTDVALNVSCGAAVLILSGVLFERGWIGGGDAKLASATAVWIGWGSILDYGIAAAIIGGLLALVILASRAAALPRVLAAQGWIARLHDSKTGVPYGIALAAAGLLQYPHTQIWAASV